MEESWFSRALRIISGTAMPRAAKIGSPATISPITAMYVTDAICCTVKAVIVVVVVVVVL
jgi:hypothetical protein